MKIKRIDVPGFKEFVEIHSFEIRGQTVYSIEKREPAGPHWMPWEVRKEDGSRHIMSETRNSLAEVEALIPEYIEDIKRWAGK